MFLPICGDPNCPNKGQIDQLKADVAELRTWLETEQTMHAAWRKRAEEAELELLKLKERSVFTGIEGLKKVDPKDLEKYEKEMTEVVIPKIVEAIDRRQKLAEESRHRWLDQRG